MKKMNFKEINARLQKSEGKAARMLFYMRGGRVAPLSANVAHKDQEDQD